MKNTDETHFAVEIDGVNFKEGLWFTGIINDEDTTNIEMALDYYLSRESDKDPSFCISKKMIKVKLKSIYYEFTFDVYVHCNYEFSIK
ncbi:MAG: hypothetical protein WC783_00845 [Candidatus Paceibacterota bacterium]|jgi:hypothetical protein